MKEQKSGKKSPKVIVIGAGIGGLTTASLLAHEGYEVKIYDQAIVPGGCASTFKRQGFIFDVGATQVAGLEQGGIHHRIFSQLKIPPPPASFCDPACVVFLPGETEPIRVWRDPEKWRLEREKQFPGSEKFWQFMQILFEISWRFQSRDPVLPPASLWDLWQLIQALRPDILFTIPFSLMTVYDGLKLFQLQDDLRLKTFLDLQLKLYSQVDTTETALLYAATALGISQAPLGLYHLQGSMQVLSNCLVASLERDGGHLLMRHQVEKIYPAKGETKGVKIKNLKTGESWIETADLIVANVTIQDLVKLVEDPPFNPLWNPYKNRVNHLPSPWGAFVIYLGVLPTAIPPHCPLHLQFFDDAQKEIGENNSLFVSVSKEGDGRAPEGMRTLIASSFTNPDIWWNCSDYQVLKDEYTKDAIKRLNRYFQLTPETIIYQESATPKTFAYYTGRQRGIVGGIGQRLSTFGPLGFGNQTPISGLWLVGDSTHPGEGTAGVSYSALTVFRQIKFYSHFN